MDMTKHVALMSVARKTALFAIENGWDEERMIEALRSTFPSPTAKLVAKTREYYRWFQS
jgi:hypothetical protein